jgi:hypothetical protein
MNSSDNTNPLVAVAHDVDRNPPGRQIPSLSIWSPQPQPSGITWPRALDSFSRVSDDAPRSALAAASAKALTPQIVTKEDVFGPSQPIPAPKPRIGAIGEGRKKASPTEFEDTVRVSFFRRRDFLKCVCQHVEQLLRTLNLNSPEPFKNKPALSLHLTEPSGASQDSPDFSPASISSALLTPTDLSPSRPGYDPKQLQPPYELVQNAARLPSTAYLPQQSSLLFDPPSPSRLVNGIDHSPPFNLSQLPNQPPTHYIPTSYSHNINAASHDLSAFVPFSEQVSASAAQTQASQLPQHPPPGLYLPQTEGALVQGLYSTQQPISLATPRSVHPSSLRRHDSSPTLLVQPRNAVNFSNWPGLSGELGQVDHLRVLQLQQHLQQQQQQQRHQSQKFDIPAEWLRAEEKFATHLTTGARSKGDAISPDPAFAFHSGGGASSYGGGLVGADDHQRSNSGGHRSSYSTRPSSPQGHANSSSHEVYLSLPHFSLLSVLLMHRLFSRSTFSLCYILLHLLHTIRSSPASSSLRTNRLRSSFSKSLRSPMSPSGPRSLRLFAQEDSR